MPPRAKSEAAIASLKDALVRQYGASSRDVVEAAVDGRLVGRSRLEKDDLDAIESMVLSASRQRRTGGVGSIRKARAASSPNLAKLTSAKQAHPDVSRPLSVATPSTGNRRATPMPRAPSMANVGRQTFAAPLPRTAPLRFETEPPYGLVVTGNEGDDVTERSCVVVRPKFPVPRQPIMKPVDHWDLIVAYDSEKYRQEQDARLDKVKLAHAKALLDTQMIEINTIRDAEAAALRKEKEDMTFQIEENKRIFAAEEEVEHRKRMLTKKANDEMTLAIQERNRQAVARRKRQEEDMTRWLANEKKKREDEEQATREEHARKCKQARDDMEAAAQEAERQRLQREEDERRLVAEMQRVMDANEAKKQAELKAREDAVAARMASVGEQVAKRDREEEQALEERLRKAQEEGDRIVEADMQRRESEHQRKVKEMNDTRAKQIADAGRAGVAEKEADRKMAERWRKQLEDGKAADKAKEDKRRMAREDLDRDLIAAIRERKAMHPQHYIMTPQVQQTEVCMNRALFEAMDEDRFQPSITQSLLTKVGKYNKLDPFPSVGRYEGDIHDSEFHDPPLM